MKKIFVLLYALFFLALTLSLAPSASAYSIDDVYWGANDHDRGDVIGDKAKFEISSMDVDLVGTTISVVINTVFANNPNAVGSFPGATLGDKGIGYGDLFLASSWTPDLTDLVHYEDDNHSNGTVWTHAFSFNDNDRWVTPVPGDTTSGTFTIYSLESKDNAVDTLLSEHFMTSATFRNGQEVAVNTDGKITNMGTGEWEIGDGYLQFTVDIAGTGLNSGPEIGLHWGLTCANDTIEGTVPAVPQPTPEPSTMLLLCSGLVGHAGFRRKFKKR